MYSVTTDQARLDIDRIHRYLSEETYWATGIARDVVQRSIENSLTFAAFEEDTLAGFARVITDYATFAYLADVFVVPQHRGRGVSRELMRAILEHPSLQGLRRWQLVTRDAHGLYEKFGFTPLSRPERHMEKKLGS